MVLGKTHAIKQAVKGHKINEVKLFIKDEMELIYRRKRTCKTNNYNLKKTTTATGLQVPG